MEHSGDTGVHSLVNLSPGTYSVTVTGANAVTLVRTYTVGAVSNMLLNNVTTNLPCNSTGGSITINITGGVQPYAYQWNTTPPQSTNVATNLLQGSYTFSVTDSLGCLLTDTLQMAPNYYWTSTSITQPNCTNNGSATVNVYGDTTL